MTIFAMPKAFTGHTAVIQRNAIRSWARLDPAPQIILFGDEPGIREMAEEIGARHIADVDRNEFGTPLVDKLFESAQDHASHPVLAYVNADVILTPDFAQAVQKVQSELPNFLLIGRRWDLVLLDEIDFAAPQWQESLSRQLAERGILHAECGLDYFVFRRGLWPQIPPFAIGRTAWDNWLVLDPQRRGIPVVDGTEFITAIHQDHDYAHLRGRRQEAWKGQEAVRNRALAGAIDDSAYSSGATWALNKDGHLAQVSPRQSGFSTAAQRTRRVAWLMRQAEWLTTRGQMELTACKWEETLTLLDKLAGSGGLGDSAGQSLDDARAAECYKTACVSLAECYRKLGLAEQVVACYTRLLEASWVAIPHARRDDITRVRDRLLDCLSRNGKPSDRSSGVSEGLPVTSETAGEDRHAAERERRGCRRLALIVSIPERQAGLRSVIGAIEGQVDEIRVLLNEFEAAPQDLYECRKVSVVETSRTGDLYASGVWTLLRPGDEGYVFILDDDIAYPPDYADRMVAKIEEHRRRAVVVVHGMDFCQPFQDYLRDRTIYRFEFARNQDGVVDAGGVGTLAFHTDTIRPQVQDFPNPNFRDLWFAILAARHEVPIVCVARAAHWLRTLDIRGRQLWHMSHRREWQDLKNRVFHEHLLPLLDTREQPGRVRKRDVTIFCFTNGRSTFDYSVQSLVESADQHQQIVLLKDMHFLEAAAKCMDLCTTPYFFKVDDDFLLHPQAVAYMQKRVLEYPHPEGLGIYYCHLWEDWTSRVRESIKVYNVDALRKIGGFKADALGKVDRMTVARLEEAGYKVVGDPSVVAVHACGDWQEQLEYERLWSSMAGTPYRKPTHDAMKRYCGTKSLDEQYAMRLGFLESVNRQLDTPFHRYLIDAAGPDAGASRTGASAARDERVSPRASGPVAGRAAAATKVSKPSSDGGLTVFAMPKAFRGHVSMIQKNAIRSWARLDPAPEIILFGDEPGIREMAEEVGARHIPEVGRNEFGTPLVDRLFEAAQDLASHDVLAYVNADMILLRDFAQAVEKVRTHFPTFLLIGQRWDLPLLEEIDFRDPQWRSRLQGQLEEHAMLHAESGLDYFVFRKGLWPHIPPFAIGRTAWDNWLVMDPRKRGVPVVDGTAYITAVHQDHDYAHVAGGRDEAWYGAEAAKNHSLAGQTDHFGLASGTTWLLGEDGELKETAPRQPQYISADYCDQHSTWLLRQARRLLAAGAKELAACKCQETLVCLDKWLKLRSIGCMPAEPAGHVDIPGRYHVGYTLLAHCQTLMGRHKQAAVTYAQLLENPHVVLTPAQRDQIVQARDRLIRHLADAGQPADSDSSVVCASSPGALCGAEIGRPPKVTVVTVCRNGQRYLKECVESILGQTMADWELLLIDDGSTDGSERLIDDFTRQDARIKPYRFPDNCGPYVRRNFAIRQAASEFIVIHDVDDIMDPVKLERLYQEINRDDALAMVGSYHRTFLDEFHDLEHTEPCELPVDHDAIAACCASWRAGISHGTAIIRKALFDTIGLYDENPFAADTFWSAKLALYAETGAPAKMANLPEYLTLIRIHAGSQTQLLPVFDPRGRRVRYRLYCECKLRRIRENWRAQPRLDVAAELRNCTCADFLTRFKAKIIQWESETLSADFVNDLLAGALSCFRQRAYVSCVSILNGLDVMQRDIARRVPGFDLLRAMAFHASGLRAQSLIHVRREIENHDSPMAGRFLHDSQEQGPSMDVRSWCLQHGSGLTLRLAGEERRQVRAIPV
jgi:glycosyltransferase involved in cell wall biosynthesis